MLADLISGAGEQLLFSSLLAATAWLISSLLGQRWPHFRYGLWHLVLIRLVLPPSLASSWSLRSLFESLRSVPIDPRVPFTKGPLEPLSMSILDAPTHPGGSIGDLLLVSLWAALAALLLGRWLYALVCLHRGLRHTEAVASAPLLAQVEEWRQRLRVRRPVALRTGDLGLAPFTTGVLRPVLYLPRPLVEDWQPDAVEPVVAHEMAHIGRFDSLWLQAQNILSALFFFHPAVWLTNRHLNGLREELCDQAALETGTMAPSRYGNSLLAVLRLNLEGTAAAPAFCHDKRRFTMRLKMILKPAMDPANRSGSRKRQARLTWSLLAVAGLLALPMGPAHGDRSSEASAPPHVAPRTDQALSPPLKASRISSDFGDRRHPISKEMVFHRGVDLVASTGEKVLAPAAGTIEVATVSYEEGAHWGTVIVLDHGGGMKTRFAHLGGLIAKTGERVEKGQPIATVGSTGVSTGPHLHFEVWVNGEVVDPNSRVASFL